ncbi:hypothetical protein K8W59_15105 [Nocardioides rotundus]|uniref:hypothetical protein n=1 Tax=Nocardioides rotundus TaxID=1774216 RepID=UPI001CBDD8E1|nr:hypothetical protein [Nocardioides rotundus]UAL29109.1 hypothetical protein K8W59_15105 [Nocardioides rotundus]
MEREVGPGSKFFVIVGSYRSDAATSRLQATGIYYVAKSLNSKPANWTSTAEHIASPDATGAIIKLTSRDLTSMRTSRYAEATEQLFQALAKKRHLLLVHEEVLSVDEDGAAGSIQGEVDSDDPEVIETEYRRSGFAPAAPEAREFFLAAIEQYGLNLMLYKTNAELSVLTSTFVEQSENNLVFRLYVPSCRLWAQEADKLLSLFRDWLSRVKGERVRQDGYHTGHGQVFEFYVDSPSDGESGSYLGFEDFSQFLELCGDDPQAAALMLRDAGTSAAAIPDLIRRFSKEVNRLRRDLRQEREAKLLSIRHRLENELSELGEEEQIPSTAELTSWVDGLVPNDRTLTSALTAEAVRPEQSQSVTIVYKPQVISTVHGVVTQEMQGSVNFGPDARQILELIERFGERERAELTSSLHELEDPDAQQGSRLAAAGKLKAFLARVGRKAEEIGTPLLIKYLEQKTGLA